MRAIIQRVKEAKVEVSGETVGGIGEGILVLLGAGKDDSDADAEYLAEKILTLRIFEDAEGKMNLSVTDIGGSLLVVSQFTLYGDCRKGGVPLSTRPPRRKSPRLSTKNSYRSSAPEVPASKPAASAR